MLQRRTLIHKLWPLKPERTHWQNTCTHSDEKRKKKDWTLLHRRVHTCSHILSHTKHSPSRPVVYNQQWRRVCVNTNTLSPCEVCLCSPACRKASTLSKLQVAWSINTHTHHSLHSLFICLNVWEAVERTGKALFTFSFPPSLPSFSTTCFTSCLPSFLLFIPFMFTSCQLLTLTRSFSLSGVFALCASTHLSLLILTVCLHLSSYWSLNKHASAISI